MLKRKRLLKLKKRDGICLKWVSPGYDGVSDRVALMSGGDFGFVEVKMPVGRLFRCRQSEYGY